MRDLTTKFGSNAGKIWSTLEKNGTLSSEEITEVTRMDKNDFFAGIGWLARENKVSAEKEDFFKIDDATNLTKKIGSNAGMVWKIIDIWEEADLITIERLSDLNEKEIHSALGWLAKEEKIKLDEKNKFTLKE